MEREFGVELARVFGPRIKRLFELEETALPPSIAERLMRLERAEKARPCPPENADAPSPRGGERLARG